MSRHEFVQLSAIGQFWLMVLAVSLGLGVLYGCCSSGAVHWLHAGEAWPWLDLLVGNRTQLSLEAYQGNLSSIVVFVEGVALTTGLFGFVASQWRSLHQWTRGLAVFTFVNILGISAVLVWINHTPLKQTGLEKTGDFLIVKESDDSWMPMFEALKIAREEPQFPLYQTVFFENRDKFQYPPTSLLAAGFIKRISPPDAYPHNKRYYLQGISRCFSWLFVMINAVAVWRILVLASHRSGTTLSNPVVGALLATALTITFYPIAASYAFGQVQTWINSLFAVTLWCWMERRQVIAGTLIGAICLLKPQFCVIILWGMLRRQWGFVGAAAAVVLVGLAVSVLIFGISSHWDYLNVLRYLSRHGETYYPNQSINGILNRLLSNGDALHSSRWFPPFHPVVYAGTLMATVVLLASALWRPQAGAAGSVDLAIVALSTTMASPIAWEHHYGILLPVYAFLLPALLAHRIAAAWTIPLLAVSYVLTSNLLPPLNQLAAAPYGLSIFQAYLFLGALIMLGLLYRLRAEPAMRDTGNTGSRPSPG
jgi:alpha-1,2-mannosyltransferase